MKSRAFLRWRAVASRALAAILLTPCLALADLEVAHSNATKVLSTTATLNAGVLDVAGTNPVCTFYWGLTNAGTTPGSWGYSTNLGTQVVGKVSADITGLTASSLYYYRLRATNAATAWAPVGSFYTLAATPSHTSSAVIVNPAGILLYPPNFFSANGIVSNSDAAYSAALTNVASAGAGTSLVSSVASRIAHLKSLLPGGIITISNQGGTNLTITATEADTLDNVCTRGATTTQSPSINGTRITVYGQLNQGANTATRNWPSGGGSGIQAGGNAGTQTLDEQSLSSWNVGRVLSGGVQYNNGQAAWNAGYVAGSQSVSIDAYASLCWGYLLAGEYQTNTAKGAWAVGKDNVVTNDFAYCFGAGVNSVETNAVHARKYYEAGAALAATYAPKTLTLPANFEFVIVPTNELPYVTAGIGPFDYAVSFTRAFIKSYWTATDATSVWLVTECASNIVANTAWVTNLTLLATNTGAIDNTAWTLEAGNMAYVFMRPGSDNDSSNVMIRLRGTHTYAQ